jgi:hypothetical protein
VLLPPAPNKLLWQWMNVLILDGKISSVCWECVECVFRCDPFAARRGEVFRFLPTILLIGAMVWSWRRMTKSIRGMGGGSGGGGGGGGPGGIFSMQKTTAKMIRPENVKQSFKV